MRRNLVAILREEGALSLQRVVELMADRAVRAGDRSNPRSRGGGD